MFLVKTKNIKFIYVLEETTPIIINSQIMFTENC